MALTRLLHKTLGRRSVRARIALACAGLFLVTGAALVAATYALVDHSLDEFTCRKSMQRLQRLAMRRKSAGNQ